MREEFQKYRSYIDDLDLTEDQKEDLLSTVYSIVESFVDRSFPLAQPICLTAPEEDSGAEEKETIDSSQMQAMKQRKIRRLSP